MLDILTSGMRQGCIKTTGLLSIDWSKLNPFRALSAYRSQEDRVTYPEDDASWAGCPIIPSPASWFKWKQRYIYDLRINGKPAGQTYMDGYGGHYPDHKADGNAYRANVWLNSPRHGDFESVAYFRLQDTSVNFYADRVGLAWQSRGPSNLLSDTDWLSFDYPLVLGKRWISDTTSHGIIPIHVEAVVVAYIPPDITSPADIIVAPGCTYTLPIDISEIPKPLAELGGKTFEELATINDEHAFLPWDAVKIPGGPRAGENVQGYYVTRIVINIMGKRVMDQELWKDVRGGIPVYNTWIYPPLTLRKKHVIKLSRRWSGTAELNE